MFFAITTPFSVTNQIAYYTVEKLISAMNQLSDVSVLASVEHKRLLTVLKHATHFTDSALVSGVNI